MTFASVNTCRESFKSCLQFLKQSRTIEQMCSDAYSITLINSQINADLKCSVDEVVF